MNGGYRLTYNGMTVKFIDTLDECRKIISDKINSNAHLKPRLVYDGTVKIKKYNTGLKRNTMIVIYEYYTCYKEIFIIEEE